MQVPNKASTTRATELEATAKVTATRATSMVVATVATTMALTSNTHADDGNYYHQDYFSNKNNQGNGHIKYHLLWVLLSNHFPQQYMAFLLEASCEEACIPMLSFRRRVQLQPQHKPAHLMVEIAIFLFWVCPIPANAISNSNMPPSLGESLGSVKPPKKVAPRTIVLASVAG